MVLIYKTKRDLKARIKAFDSEWIPKMNSQNGFQNIRIDFERLSAHRITTETSIRFNQIDFVPISHFGLQNSTLRPKLENDSRSLSTFDHLVEKRITRLSRHCGASPCLRKRTSVFASSQRHGKRGLHTHKTDKILQNSTKFEREREDDLIRVGVSL